MKKNIRLIDYEVITDSNGQRLIAFGKFAGIVGAHNGIRTYLKGIGIHDLPRMIDCKDYEAVKAHYRALNLPPIKVVLTGAGRVANGAASVLQDMKIKKVTPLSFLLDNHNQAVFTQINSFYYATRKDGKVFSSEDDFYENPESYGSTFSYFWRQADLFINGIYWDKRAPAFFTLQEMADPHFRINTIADITCDIAPESSVPSTLRPATIDDPVFGFDPATGEETQPFQPGVINMMTIDNLPNELPRDASREFGDMFMHHIVPELTDPNSPMLWRASITDGRGKLNSPFAYLESFVKNEV